MWPKQVYVRVVHGVDYNVEPYAKYAGEEHLQEAGLVVYAEYLHYLFEKISQWIGCQRPEYAYCRSYQERMYISVDWVTKSELCDDKHLYINYYVGEHKDREVNPLSKSEGDEAARSKMIWRKRHLKLPSRNSKD